MIIFLKRRSDMSEQEFYNYWAKHHGALVAPWAVKHGVLSYKQVCSKTISLHPHFLLEKKSPKKTS